MKKTRWWRRKRRTVIPVVLVLLAAYCAWTTLRPLPALKAVHPTVNAEAKVPTGLGLFRLIGEQAAVGVIGDGNPIVQTHGQQTSVPTASTAKLITVLSVLRQKPLTLGQQGPMITITANDVAIFNSYVKKDGSLVPVKLGEQISEYQALQAILLPSANNMADSLAIWAFGSLEAYSAYANNYIASLGLSSTHVGVDASGFDPSTVSSAGDLVKLGELVMQNPVLAQIVGQKTATLPVAGTVRNVNYLLGFAGFVGVKTGNTDQAGGVFVGASQSVLDGKPITIVTAITGSTNLATAMKHSLTLMQGAQNNFEPLSIVEPGTIVGQYKLPWGASVSVVADTYIRTRGWAGGSIPYTVHLKPLPAKASAGNTVGTVKLPSTVINQPKTVSVKLKTAVPQPSIWWRLLHPF